MSHELSIRKDGFVEFVSANGQDAWHKLGQKCETALTWEECIELAGLNWGVYKDQLYNSKGQPVESWGIFRSDTDTFLGSVGERYTPLQNTYQFQFVDTLLQAEGGRHYDTAGALREGRIVFCTVNLGSFALFEKDHHETNVAFLTSHDGTMAIQCFLADTRIECANTMNMALKGASNIIKVKHTRRAEERLEHAKSFFQVALLDMTALKEKMEAYSNYFLKDETYTALVEELLPNDSTRTKNIREMIRELYINDCAYTKEIAGSLYSGTMYNLFNAVTEYVDHRRSVRGDELIARPTSALIGPGNDFKLRAMTIMDKALQSI